MTTASAIVTVSNNTFETVESVANISFTAGTIYTMQIQNIAEIKIADAIFTVENQIFRYTAGEDDLYIRTPGLPCILTILEGTVSGGGGGGGTPYILPTASTTTLGGVKIDGTTITINDGTISSSGGGVSDHSQLTNLDFNSSGHTGFLDYNASNLTSTGQKVFDGQWTKSYYKYMEQYDLTNLTNATVKTDVDMSAHLPDDGYTYEVILTWWLQATIPTDVGTVKVITCAFDHNIIDTDFCYAYLGRATTYKIANSTFFTVPNLGSQILVVPPSRKIRIVTYKNSEGNMSDVAQVAYRRVGTNS